LQKGAVVKVAIVGSGIAALACAVALKEKGIDFKILEKEPFVGGKITTDKIEGFTVEGGPDSFLPEKYWSVDLIKKVGLERELLPTNDQHKGTYIFSHRRLHRLPEGVMLMVPTMIMPLVRSRLISMRGKVRMGMEPFIPKKLAETDESLAQFVTRRLGRECLEKIAEPLVAGIHTSNPDNMSVKATFPRFLAMEQKSGSLIKGMVSAMKKASHGPGTATNGRMTYFMSLKDGMQRLVDGCASFIGEDKIHTSTEVREIRKTERGFTITLPSESENVEFVVLASPSYASADLIRNSAPVLADRLASITWSSTATISLAFRKADLETNLQGFGFLVPRIEERRINAATWSSIKWSFRAPADSVLIRCFVGGGHHEELVDRSDDELTGIVLDELRAITGIAARPHFSKIYRWERSMPRYTVGHLDRVAAIDNALNPYAGLFLIGSSYKGIGIGDCIKSGFDAANTIAESIDSQQR
jgi:protoporphyrinogen/coproporphyrinogen III oxidase